MRVTNIKRTSSFGTTVLTVAFLATLTGCGGDGMSPVVGSVTVAGKPLEQGAITFEPLDGMGPTAGATIQGGKYETKAPPGDKKVRITGFEITGQVPAYKGMKNSPMRDVVKEVVPSKYNTASELTITVKTSDTDGSFDLN